MRRSASAYSGLSVPASSPTHRQTAPRTSPSGSTCCSSSAANASSFGLTASTAVVVDHRVAQDAVEPGGRRLVALERPELVEAPDERLLQDVFGDGAVAHALLEEREKVAVIVDEGGDDLRAQRCFGRLHLRAG